MIFGPHPTHLFSLYVPDIISLLSKRKIPQVVCYPQAHRPFYSLLLLLQRCFILSFPPEVHLQTFLILAFTLSTQTSQTAHYHPF